MWWQLALNKILSGRFILTVITGIVFAFASWKGWIPKDTIATIIVMVFTLYFSRTDRNGKPPTGGAV